jgi:hypothetical protein
LSVYTLLQLVEVVAFGTILLVGVILKSPPITILGGGLLIGKAVLNILAPEGGSVYRRSLIGYVLGAVYFGVGILLLRLLG